MPEFFPKLLKEFKNGQDFLKKSADEGKYWKKWLKEENVTHVRKLVRT